MDKIDLIQRIENYLAAGGLNNPELMDHERVRDLIIDCRDALAQPEQEPFKPDWVSYRQGVADGAAQPEPTPRQRQRLRQEAWKNIKQDEYKFDPEVCFAMGFDVGYGAVARKVEPSQEECGGFDSRPAPRKEWVGLTVEEIRLMVHSEGHGGWNDLRLRSCWHGGYVDGVNAANAKLKELNK